MYIRGWWSGAGKGDISDQDSFFSFINITVNSREFESPATLLFVQLLFSKNKRNTNARQITGFSCKESTSDHRGFPSRRVSNLESATCHDFQWKQLNLNDIFIKYDMLCVVSDEPALGKKTPWSKRGKTWWRHQKEFFRVTGHLCGDSPVAGYFLLSASE